MSDSGERHAAGQEAATTAVEPEAEAVTSEAPAGERGVTGRRLAAVGLGGALAGYGLRRRGTVRGRLATVAGVSMVARGLRGGPATGERLRGLATTRRRLEPGASAEALSVERSVTVDRSAEELEEYWLEPRHLSRILGGYASVHGVADGRVRVTVRGPMGWQRSWQLHLTEHERGERMHWESAEAAAVPSEVTVEFRPAPGDRGTEVHVGVRWDPPGGRVGRGLLQRLGVGTSAQLGAVLSRFQSLAETGEVPTLEGNPSARGAGDAL